jgi:hypothetical protein
MLNLLNVMCPNIYGGDIICTGILALTVHVRIMNEHAVLDPVHEHILCTSKKLVAP